MISNNHKDILDAKKCPYCKGDTKKISQKEVYGKSYSDRIFICCVNFPKCDSYVGTHSDGTPLGRLANKGLRGAKKEAHNYFDKIWKSKIMDRSSAYKWLSKQLKIPSEFTHIGMFSVDTCLKVKILSIQKLKC